MRGPQDFEAQDSLVVGLVGPFSYRLGAGQSQDKPLIRPGFFFFGQRDPLRASGLPSGLLGFRQKSPLWRLSWRSSYVMQEARYAQERSVSARHSRRSLPFAQIGEVGLIWYERLNDTNGKLPMSLLYQVWNLQSPCILSIVYSSVRFVLFLCYCIFFLLFF